MRKNECTTSKDGTTFTTFEFHTQECAPRKQPLPPEERRHREIKRELRNISSSIDGLCIIMFIIGIVFLFKGCSV